MGVLELHWMKSKLLSTLLATICGASYGPNFVLSEISLNFYIHSEVLKPCVVIYK